MPVVYDGVTLVPAPFVEIVKTPLRNSDNQILDVEYTITLTGTIVNVDNALDSGGASTATLMEGILLGQQTIRNAFKDPSGLLEITHPAGASNKLQFNCIVENVNFQSGTWVNRNEYVIVLKSYFLEGSTDTRNDLISTNENWSINDNENGTFSMNHQLQAVGRLVYTSGIANNPLSIASGWVRNRSYTIATNGTLTPINAGIQTFNLSNLIFAPTSATANYWNKSNVETVDPTNYTWGVTETFIHAPSGNAIEEWSATISIDNSNFNKMNIGLNGSVIGHANNNKDFNAKYANALSKFSVAVEPAFYNRVLQYATNYNVNPIPLSKQITHENIAGAIRYSVNYMAVSGTPIIDNALEESINVTDVGGNDVFAQIQVPGRTYGPVFQYMNTVTSPERAISITATMSPSGTTTYNLASLLSRYMTKPNTNAIINALKPHTGYFYLQQDSEDFNPISRQYSRQVRWVLQSASGVNISGIPSGLRNPSPL